MNIIDKNISDNSFIVLSKKPQKLPKLCKEGQADWDRSIDICYTNFYLRLTYNYNIEHSEDSLHYYYIIVWLEISENIAQKGYKSE